jgi:hypothetical protein
LSQITLVNAFLILVFTAWLVGARFKIRADSNWPFVYYAVLVFFHQSLPGVLSPLPIYIAAVCALFLRFEYMSRSFRGVFRVAEVFGLAYIIMALISYVGF